ncbi:MAG: NADH-quinone oxidoreductase subunit C [Desulfobacterales bacterium]|nr:NADH-quinone oxidoreductase subunit C [Desulfobacterales bacterium]
METLDITKDTLREEVEKIKSRGYRFVTITCLELDENTLEMIYHFDRELEIIHYRMQVAKDETMPSLSPVFFAAFLVENEIYDQFGMKFDGLVLDFGGTLYLDEDDDITATPFCKFGVKQVKS